MSSELSVNSQDVEANRDSVDVSLHVNETSSAEFMEEVRRDSVLSEGEISDDSAPGPDVSQEPAATQGELVFEEGLSGISLSVDKLEEALLSPASREEGELISERGATEKEEGEHTDDDAQKEAVVDGNEHKDDDEDDTPSCKFFLQELKSDVADRSEDKESDGKKSPKTPIDKETDQVTVPPPFPPPIPFPPMLTPGMPPPLLPPLPPFPPFPPTLMPPFFPGFPVPPPLTPSQLPTPLSAPLPEKKEAENAQEAAEKPSGDEKESDEDKLQEQHWLKGLKTGRTAYTVANRRRELALTEPLEVFPESSPEEKPKKRWANRPTSKFSKMYAPGYSPEYPEDDPQYSAFATFADNPDEVKKRSPRYSLPHTRSLRRRRYIGSPDSDHIWRHRRRRSSDRFLSHSRSEGEQGSRSPLSHLTISSRSSSCSSTFAVLARKPDLPSSPSRPEIEEILQAQSASPSSSSSSSTSSDSDSSSEASSDSSSLSYQSSLASSQPRSPGHDPADGSSPLPKKLKLEKAIKASYGSDISDDDFGISDEEGGRKDSKKYKELSKDRPSISFSLGRTKLKSHSEFTGKKTKKLAVSSPEIEDDNFSNRKQDLPKKYEIIEAAKKEAREKKEQKLMKRKMKIAKMKFIKPKVIQDNGANPPTNQPPAPTPSDASFQHKIKVERVAPPEPKPAPVYTSPSDSPAVMHPSELSLVKEMSFEKGLPPLNLENSGEVDKVTPTQPLPPPPQVQMFTTGGSNRSTSDGRALSYKQKLLRSNLADTRRDDSHLKLDAGRNNRMGRNYRGRGGKMIVNKDGSTTMVPFQREGQQMGAGQMGTVGTGIIPKSYSGNNTTSGRMDGGGAKQKSATRKHESHSKKKDLAEFKEKLMKDLESINALINEKAQDLT